VTPEREFDRQMAAALRKEFGYSDEKCLEILEFIAEFALTSMVLVGPVNTPYGKLAFTDKGVQVVEQNAAVLGTLGKEASREAVVAAVRRIVEG
jgi:hypothetical protein